MPGQARCAGCRAEKLLALILGERIMVTVVAGTAVLALVVCGDTVGILRVGRTGGRAAAIHGVTPPGGLLGRYVIAHLEPGMKT